MENKNVAIIGASNKPERYSYKCLNMLQKYHYEPFLVHPKLDKIDNNHVYRSLHDIEDPIDTATIYINPKFQGHLEEELISKNIRRVIFNPGTESQELEKRLKAKGIKVECACTLVLLSTNQFE